jgi:uncharacterized protein (TIRG00374 family)
MPSTKFQLTWKTVLLPIIGILAFFLYLYIFRVDIPTIIAVTQQINLYQYSLAIIFVILETFFFALSWRFLINFLSVKLSVFKSLIYVWYGIFMDILVPSESISGEISRIYLVTREQNGVSGKVVASLVVHRFMGIAINIISLLVSIIVLLTHQNINPFLFNLLLFLIVISLLILILIISLSFKESWTLRIATAVINFIEYISRGRWKLESIRKNVTFITKTFHESIKEFTKSPQTIFLSVLFYLLSWLFSLGVTFLVFLSIQFPVHWSYILITSSIVVTVKAVPLGIPFETGLPEITMSTIYIFLGVPPDISATVTILTRILSVWFRFFVGFVIQQWLTIKEITRKPA